MANGGEIKSGASTDEQTMIKDLKSFTNEFYLEQEIVTPTHSKGNTLDLLFTNNSHLLHSYESNETVFSDHYLVEGKINYRNSDCLKEIKRTSPNRKKYSKNFEHLNFFSEKIKWEKVSGEDFPLMKCSIDFSTFVFLFVKSMFLKKEKHLHLNRAKFHGREKISCAPEQES